MIHFYYKQTPNTARLCRYPLRSLEHERRQTILSRTRSFYLNVFMSVLLMLATNASLNAQDSEIIIRKINLTKAVKLAVVNDYELRKLKFDAKAYQAEDKQANINYLPQITTEIISRNNANIVSNPRGTTIFSSYSTLTMPLYDRSVIYTKRKARSRIILNRLNIIKRMNDVCKEIITLYYSVLNLKAIVKIRKQEYSKAAQTLQFTSKKLQYDKAIPLDLLLTRGLVVKSKNEWLNSKNDYENERLKLLSKLNLKENEDIKLNTPKKKLLTKMSLKRALRIARRERTDIKARFFDLKVKKELYEIERSLMYPKIELFSDLRYSQRSGSTDQLEWSVFVMASMAILDDFNVKSKAGLRKYGHLDKALDEESIKLSFNDGTSKRTDKSEAKASYLTAREEVRELRLQIKQDISDAYYQLIKAKNAIKLARLNVKIGKGLLKKVTAENRLGRKAMEDLIEAFNNNVQYQVEYQQAILNFHLAVLNLKWAMGILWKDFFIKVTAYE